MPRPNTSHLAVGRESPSWHSNARKSRQRARNTVANAIFASPRSLQSAIGRLSCHHGHTMGKWWKCRSCSWYSAKGEAKCGGCGAAYVRKPPGVVPAHGSPAATAAASSTSWSIGCAGQGSVNRWSKWKHARDKVWSQAEWEQWNAEMRIPDSTAVAVVSDMEVDIATPKVDCAAVRCQMQSLNAIIAAMKGRQDAIAIAASANAEKELKALRIQLTLSKSLEEQLGTVSALTERRLEARDAAAAALIAAQENAEMTEVEYLEAHAQLEAIKQKIGLKQAEESILEVAGAFTGLQMEKLKKAAASLESSKAAIFVECLDVMEPLFRQAGMTPDIHVASRPEIVIASPAPAAASDLGVDGCISPVIPVIPSTPTSWSEGAVAGMASPVPGSLTVRPAESPTKRQRGRASSTDGPFHRRLRSKSLPHLLTEPFIGHRLTTPVPLGGRVRGRAYSPY